jgi:anti-anti-sigma factor
MGAESGLVAERVDGGIVLRVSGRLDLSSAPALCAAIDRVASTAAPARVVVDLRRVESCDSRCVVALINAAREAGVRLGRRVALDPGEGPIAGQLARAGAAEFLAVSSAPGTRSDSPVSPGRPPGMSRGVTTPEGGAHGRQDRS